MKSYLSHLECTYCRATVSADRPARTCPECGHQNPMGYCWNTAKDTPEEAEARKLW